jgi:NitT/TauT family transport system substrate-binding protein
MFKRSLKSIGLIFGLIVSFGLLAGCGTAAKTNADKANDKVTIIVGHFPNITHSQALVGLSDGTFAKALGNKVIIDRKLFNAGPAEIEALLAGEIDLGYIGPVPAINGYVKSKGGLQIIAGATNAGAVLVVREGAGINDIKDLAGKKVAVPQFGNTQDISLRKILKDAGLEATTKGGNVEVLQVENPDILTGFGTKALDAALVPEPWGSRLVSKAGGKVLLDWNEVWRDGNYTSAVVIVRSEFLKDHPDLVENWLKAHVEITEAINKDSEKYKSAINAQLKELTKKELSKEILDNSFVRIKPTFNPTSDSVKEFVTLYVDNGYLKSTPNIAGLINLEPLNKVLKEKGLAEVK